MKVDVTRRSDRPDEGRISSSLTSLSSLVRESRNEWSIEEAASFAAEHGVEAIALMHLGGDTRLKTLDFVPTSQRHLASILAGGERADGSSLFPLTASAPRSDLLLQPRLETAFVDPFEARRTLVFLCGHAGPDGAPFELSPDSVVRAAMGALEESGVELWAHGEVEFFLGRPAQDATRAEREGGYQASAPDSFGQAARREAQALLTGMGVPVKYAHAEVGRIPAEDQNGLAWEQHEIELALAPLRPAADAVVLTRWVVARVAGAYGLTWSFDPVVRAGHAGNGLHFHLSPQRRGGPLECLLPDGTLAPDADKLVHALLRHAGALMAFGNRSELSFQRLTDGGEVPAARRWGVSDRRALVRVPVLPRTRGGSPTAPPTIEYRLADGSAAPHLLLAGIAAAFLDELSLDPASETMPYGALPRTRADVAAELESGRDALQSRGIVPAALIDATLAALRTG